MSNEQLQDMESRLYFHRAPLRLGNTATFQKILYGESNVDAVSRTVFVRLQIRPIFFFHLHKHVRDHPIFFLPSNGNRIHAPSELQLFVLLKYLGVMGTSASNRADSSHFIIRASTAELYRKRVLLAVTSLEEEGYQWPDEQERIKIARENSSKL